MALEIRRIPVLTGETAERFVREAEENERNSQRKALRMSFADVEKIYGQETTDSFCKFYIRPDATHGWGVTMDYMSWLDQWCTTGNYPQETLYATMRRTHGQMPMAEYPGWVKYIGGDPMSGTSYQIIKQTNE